jgi:hypothetical protein
MARARIVAPPPQDYIPEPLVSVPPPPEEVVAEQWIEGNLQEEIVEVENNEPSQEELEKERIAQEKYEELQLQKVEQESKVSAELQSLREENQRLINEKEAAEKAREDQIVKMRQKATEQKVSHQLNIVNPSKPSIKNRIKHFFRKRRIERATISVANYEHAIIHQAAVAVPKMLDEIEKMHESLTILEELLEKHKEREKIIRSEKHPRQ